MERIKNKTEIKYNKKKYIFFWEVVECKKKKLSFETPRGGYFKSRESVDHRFMSNKNIGTVRILCCLYYFIFFKLKKKKINTVRIF